MTEESTAPMTERDSSKPLPLTGRERRRRMWLLAILLLLLALLAYTTYYFMQNRTLPVIGGKSVVQSVEPPRYLYSITGKGKNQLMTPTGVGVSADGRVYAVDLGRRRISIFTNSGTYISSFNDNLTSPVHLWVTKDEVWVSDRRQETLEVFDLKGKHLYTFDPGEGFVWSPLALAFDDKGNLRTTDVKDKDKHRLVYFSADGSRTAVIGHSYHANTLEEEPAGFSYPNGVAISKDGRVYVADGNNRRVQVFDSKGNFEAFVDTSGIPRGLAIDSSDRLYVVDAVAHTVDVFSLAGKRITRFGGRGTGPGQFNYPNDVALDKRGHIYVSDRENDQIQVWGWPVAELPKPLRQAPRTPWGWLAYIAPLLILPILPLTKKRRIVVTPDFITALVTAGEVAAVSKKRNIRLIAPEADRTVYEGLVAEGVELDKLIRFEAYSESDANALKVRYGFSERDAALLSMAERSIGLGTEDEAQRQEAKVADLRALTCAEFIDVFIRKNRR